MKFFRKPPIESTLPILVILALLILSGGGAWLYFRGLLEADLPGIEVKALDLGNRQIQFIYTDDNEDETLIIHADQQVYNEFSRADVYFSITPLQPGEEKVLLQFLFSDPQAKITGLWQRQADRWRPLALVQGLVAETSSLQAALAKKKPIPQEFLVQARAEYASLGQTEYFRAAVAFPPQTAGEFWIEALGTAGGYGLLDPWYNSSWGYRKQIQIDYNKISGASGHTNFPMLFSRTDPDLRDTSNGGKVASSTAGDIVFVDWENKKIDHEIESYTATTGQLIAWVEVPFVSSTSTRDLFIYYGNSSATYQPTNEQVWEGYDFRGVWHLNETSAGTAAVQRYDATSESNDLTDNATVASASAQVAQGADFEFANIERLDRADNASLSITGTAFTASAWVNLESLPSTNAQQGTINTKGSGATNRSWLFHVDNSPADKLEAGFTTNCDSATEILSTANTSLTTATWYHTAIVYNGTDIRLYLNGALDNTATAFTSSIPDCTSVLALGNRATDSRKLDGIIDEARVGAVAFSAGWILTEYRNQVSPTTFAAYGGQEVETRPAATPGVKVTGPGPEAAATPTFVQKAQGSSGFASSLALPAFASSVGTGNFVVVGACVQKTFTPDPTITVSDNKGNTYAAAVGPTRAYTGHCYTFYSANVSGGTNFIVTLTISDADGYPTGIAAEYSGIATTSPLDKTAAASAVDFETSVSSGATAATTQAKELVFGMVWPKTTGNDVTAGTGFTERAEEDSVNDGTMSIEDKNVTSTGAQTCTATNALSDRWIAQCSTYKAAPAAAAGVKVKVRGGVKFRWDAILREYLEELVEGTGK